VQPLTNQTFRDGVHHETKARANAKPAQAHRKVTSKQPLEKTVLNFRSQEVKRKTPQNKAFSGVFVFGCRQFAAGVLAETKGFEPLMQVYARMLP
jgi:hypothetical protein